MPSWPIHIGLANKLNKKLNLGDDFILGNILPDSLDGYIFTPSNITNKNTSHYRTNKRIDLDKFLKINKNKLNNPIILGFLTHLITDRFYNGYTAKNHFFQTENGIKVILNDNTYTNKSLTTLAMKQNEYIKYGKKLANKKELGKPITITDSTINNLKDLKDFNYTKEDLETAINIMNDWINNKTKIDSIEYKLYTEKELDEVYNDCYEFIIDYLDKLKD